MGYNSDIYESAVMILQETRKRAESEANRRKSNFYKRCPRAGEIEKELSSTAISAAKAILNGSDTTKQLTALKERNLSLQNELTQLLERSSLSPDYLDVNYKCRKCKDEGYVDGIICSCMKQLLKRVAYDRLNKLSPLSLSSFDSFSLDHYSDEPAMEGYPSAKKRMSGIFNFCVKYAKDFTESSPSLLMQGKTGLGKTHLSLSIARSAIDKGYGVVYGSAHNIISALEKEKFSYNKDIQSYKSEQHLIDCDLLILDDLGTEFSTSFSSATIYNIINSRIMNSRPTIISTNLSMRELERSYSERLVSRIMGNHKRLEFLGSDIRQKKFSGSGF